MEDAWFTGVADELARCLVDARNCAAACEQLLENARGLDDDALRQRLVSALVAPAAVARVLGDLIEQPPSLVLAACRLYCDSARGAIDVLEGLDLPIDASGVLTALRTSAESCQRLIDAAS